MATPTRQTFSLTGSDGLPLRGDVRSGGGRRPAVIICHGLKGFKDWGFFPYLADTLARAGFAAVSFNFSGSGVGPDNETFSELERFGHNTYTRELEDLEIVVEALRAGALGVRAESYGLVGHSMGGGIAALRTATDSRVRALVTWAGVALFGRLLAPLEAELRTRGESRILNQRTGELLPVYRDIIDDLDQHGAKTLDVLGAAAAIHQPWLIVHGDADESVPVSDAQALHRASGGRAELVIVEGAGHTFGAKHPWAGTTPALDRAVEASVESLTRAL